MIRSSSETYMAAMRLRNSVFSIAEHVPRKQMQFPLDQSTKRVPPVNRQYTININGGIASLMPGAKKQQTKQSIALTIATSSRKARTRRRGSGREENCSRNDESLIPGRVSCSGEGTATYLPHDPGKPRSPSAAPEDYPECCLSCRSGSQAFAFFQYPAGFSTEQSGVPPDRPAQRQTDAARPPQARSGSRMPASAAGCGCSSPQGSRYSG